MVGGKVDGGEIVLEVFPYYMCRVQEADDPCVLVEE